MYKNLETKSFFINRIPINNNFVYNFVLKPNQSIIKSTNFKKIYLDSIDLIWNKVKNKNNILSTHNELPCLYMSFSLDRNDRWVLFCESEFLNLGLCTEKPLNQLSIDLVTLIKLVELENKNINILPIHLNLTLFDRHKEHIHANVLILDFKKKQIYLFEPKGHIDNFFYQKNNFFFYFNNVLKRLSEKSGWKFKGYLSPNLRFQTNDNQTCYLWTAWCEIICLFNYTSTIETLQRFFRKQYNNNLINPFKVSHYLLELYLDN